MMADEAIDELWRIKDDMPASTATTLRGLPPTSGGKQGEDGPPLVGLRALRECGQRRESARSVP